MVKITDVARRAGVSPSTVSYALSGKRPISDETRRRVQAAVRELGYRPHARGAAGAGSRVLALAVPMRSGVHVPVVTQFAVAVATAARAHDHDVLLLTQGEGVEGIRRVAETGPADGLVVMDVQLQDPRLPLLRALPLPSVLIGVPAEPDGLTCVDLDFGAAGELCVDHLVRLGHRTVALVGSPPEVYVRRTAFARRLVQGFTAAADRHRIGSTVHPCAPGRGAARVIAERLLREQPTLTGVVVHNEPLIDPLIDAFAELGVRIPDDLSLTAVCPAPAAASARVPLTSVTVPSAELGTRAVHLLVRKMSGVPAPAVTLLAPRLTERASTGPRPA
ncbi:LacI family DNA-binding transcriptional regulator [Streptomyces sp. KMM 9044]|uniref:LacI family DNA-binding transcriptional regulator n=1 Tax=Streptomyces sp. KMM 9044 TaxID=2744474 RepID=UPI0021513C19|nr:LacI family DNA-binding transcriptional regulator [Streptomyces sp. KMM 9044]WAX79750.1 LacI family DNA-binding transcriptional regulator [Streptomyces sp. KMM 9044]